MAQTRQRRRLSATVALATWLGLGLATPIIVSFYSPDIIGDAVEAAPSDAFTITEPVVIASSPSVRIERGTIALVDKQGLPVPTTAHGLGTAAGHNVRLFNAVVAIGGQQPSPQVAQGIVAPLVEALISGRYETLSLRRTTVTMKVLGDTPETITDVKADVVLRRRGLVTIKGTGMLRGRSIAVDATANAAQLERLQTGATRLPIKISVKGAHIDLGFEGRMSMSDGEIDLRGQGELAVPSIRQAARWFGAYWPSGPGLRNAAIRGEMSLARQNLTFEKANVRMDGNEATGVLAMRGGAPRPVITGTLAFKAIDTKPYFASPDAAALTAEPLSWSSLAAGVLTVPLGLHLDADVRISADKVVLGGVEFGRSAATVALKDGRLLADLAELKFNGGEGGGQITADFTGYLPKFTVRGKLERVDAGSLSSSLMGRGAAQGHLLQGQAHIVADFAGSGATLQDVLKGLTGKFVVRLSDGVRLGLDLRGLAAASRLNEVTGWEPATRGTTGFDQMDLRLVLRDGTVLTESADGRSGDGIWSATGFVNLLSNRIDLRLTQTATTPSGPPGATTMPLAVLEVRGPLDKPSIRYGAEAERLLPR